MKLRNLTKELMKDDIIDNPDSIKKNFIEGEILPEITKVDGKETKDVNVVREVRNSYKKLMTEQRKNRSIDLF